MDNNAIAQALIGLAKSLAASEKTAADVAELSPEQQAQVNEIIEATERIEKVKGEIKAAAGKLQSELRALEKKAKQLDEELGPVVASAADQLVRAKKAVLKYNPTKSQRPSYQTAWNEALNKVNENTRRVLEEIGEATRKISSYLDIEMTASVKPQRRKVAGVMDFVKNMFTAIGAFLGLVPRIKNEVKSLETSIDQLEKAAKA